MLSERSWQTQDLTTRIKIVHTDIMRHPEFALLAGVVCIGDFRISDTTRTASTNGRDIKYGRKFSEPLNQKQMRYLVLHENGHKAMRHCVEYREITRKYPKLSNIAQDHVINLMIEECDPHMQFVERPLPNLYCDKKYTGMSFIEVLQDLIKNPPEDDGEGGGGSGNQVLDEHEDGSELGDDVLEQLGKDIDEALRQGKILSDKMRGKGKGGNPLDATIQQRETDWREALLEFLQSVCAGYDNSRFCPPNKRMLPLDVIMPSHFSERIGELILAPDTSGSMDGVYPTVFGEVARLCEIVMPESVRVIWWDDGVNSEQVFMPDEYDRIASLLKPQGGGGTRVSCVAEYIAEKQYKPVAVVYLTDGYIESNYKVPDLPCLWGVVDNKSFKPLVGVKIDISSINI
jgi:predicted metal-dependent peptidase